jgi:hypothetical protein
MCEFFMHGLREEGVIGKLRRRRQRRIEELRNNDRQREQYETKLRAKLGATLVTLAALGSISFAMVVFALLLALVEQRQAPPLDRVAFSFIVGLLVTTSVLMVVNIESYDTALDPVWNIAEIDRIRGFTGWTYSLALCLLVYTVAFTAFIVWPILGVFTSLLFAALVIVYDLTKLESAAPETPLADQERP